MKIYSEEQILDLKVRKQIIEDINSGANVARKTEARKRNEVYKDNTIKYVLQKLANENLRKDTLTLMSNRATNVSICRKIINKLSRSYHSGVQREVAEKTVSESVSMLAMALGFDFKMKKADRYLHLQKNCLPWIMPELYEPGKWTIKLKVFGPWQYDAVENFKDHDCPVGIVLSDFVDSKSQWTPNSGQFQTQGFNASASASADSTIAPGPMVTDTCEKAETYIWWSKKYHFTFDKAGAIIASMSPADLLNPIGELPGVPMAKDRDDSFWAGGGEDLADGSILVNTMLTDLNAIMFMQGWGQMVIVAPKGGIPEKLESGPHSAMCFTYDSKKGEAPPDVKVVNSNPPVDSWMKSIEQTVALLLSTNNLSPSTVAAKLDAVNFPSGIAMLIEKSESTEDVKETQLQFALVERKLWSIYAKWHNLYHGIGQLWEDLAVVGKLPENLEVSAKFNPGGEVTTESEKLANMKAKWELGIVSKVELLMEENPGMSEEEAMAKLLKIQKEKLDSQASAGAQMIDGAMAGRENLNLNKGAEQDGDQEGDV